MVWEKIVDWLNVLLAEFYSKMLVAALILLIGIIIGRLVGKLVEKILSELEINRILKKATNIDMALEKVVSKFISYFIYFITVIMALNQLNITTTILQMLSAAVILILIISIVLAVKDFIPNAFAGFYIYRNKFLREGESIRVKGMEGKIIHINLVETKIETKEGDIVYIPNSALTKTEVVKVKGRRRSKRK